MTPNLWALLAASPLFALVMLFALIVVAGVLVRLVVTLFEPLRLRAEATRLDALARKLDAERRHAEMYPIDLPTAVTTLHPDGSVTTDTVDTAGTVKP